MKHRLEYLKRAIDDYEHIIEALKLSTGTVPPEKTAHVLLIAARIEALEDAISEGLPTAGEGI